MQKKKNHILFPLWRKNAHRPFRCTHSCTLSVKWREGGSDGHQLAWRDEVIVCETKTDKHAALPYIVSHTHVNCCSDNTACTLFTACVSSLSVCCEHKQYNGTLTFATVQLVTGRLCATSCSSSANLLAEQCLVHHEWPNGVLRGFAQLVDKVAQARVRSQQTRFP